MVGVSRRIAVPFLAIRDKSNKIAVWKTIDVELLVCEQSFEEEIAMDEVCFVYIITDDGGLCKIGISNSPNVRVSTIRTERGRSLRCFKTFRFRSREEAYYIEQATLVGCGRRRVGGEWISCEPSVLERLVLKRIGNLGRPLHSRYYHGGVCLPFPGEVERRERLSGHPRWPENEDGIQTMAAPSPRDRGIRRPIMVRFSPEDFLVVESAVKRLSDKFYIKISLNNWIVSACREKLEREERASSGG